MKQTKVLVATSAVVATCFAGFLMGSIYTDRCILGIGFVKAVNALCHGTDDGFRF